MGLLQKLKSLFGSDQKRQSRGRGSEPDVTVEREPSAESEHAVKGTAGADQQAGQPQGQQETQQQSQQDAHSQDQQNAQPQDQPATESETEETADSDQQTESEDTDDESGGPSLEEIKGIGPTYADRLRKAGYETVPDLGAADAEAVADAAQTGEGRASDWIERAQEF